DTRPCRHVKLFPNAIPLGIGLISDLDLLVVQEALRVIRQAITAEQNPPDIAVNISAVSLNSKIFMDQFDEVARPFTDVLRKLLVDVTELGAITEMDVIKVSLTRLRKMGIRRCLGDIGGGGNTFMALSGLNVDFAKIDGDMINAAMKDSKDRAILQSTIQICSHLGILVIAEKVETEEQRQFLRSQGVNLGQGYLLGRPSADLLGIASYVRAAAKGRTMEDGAAG
ncbi:MAG: EAL domain-containing protein, partial [Rhodospirillaceae bacterium]